MTHREMVEVARRWLRGSARCSPVLSGIASTSEIPDAIGWSSSYKHRGSIVVECKTTVSDLRRDGQKAAMFRHPEHGWLLPGRGRVRSMLKQGYERAESAPTIGRYRYFLLPRGLADPAKVVGWYPDHGVLLLCGSRVCRAVAAPRREHADLDSEIRLLRFALVHLEHNLAALGCAVDLVEATKFAGARGIELPGKGGAPC